MNKSAKLGCLLASAMTVACGAVFAQAKDIPAGKTNPAYVTDARGNIVVDPFGLCVRTPAWTPQLAGADGWQGAGCTCDKDVLPKEVCSPPPPPPPPPPAAEKVTLAADALFDFDKATLRKDATDGLDALVSKLTGVTLEVIVLVGHTDSVGADAYNQKLSVRRAEAVKAYLVSKGIEANRIYTEGKGESQPVADNKTAEGRAKNRRVDVEVVGTRAVRR